ncbi:MAG: LysM peptidoglycan-binding domain-containing protein [Phycisphaerales bacterium]|nr:LysM peptidoglycan-binding domain-containing protein [Phycisphaerales bacterium]
MRSRPKAILGGIILVGIVLLMYHFSPFAGREAGVSSDADAVVPRDAQPADPLSGIIDPLMAEHDGVDAPREDDFPLPPGFTLHVVARGETMESIAEHTYGSTSKWEVIAHENPLVDPVKLRPGTKLRLPPLDYERPGGYEPVEQLPQQETIHVVRKNETLGHIALRYYGKASKWPVILAANRDKINKAEDVRPGMRLVIPPDFD